MADRPAVSHLRLVGLQYWFGERALLWRRLLIIAGVLGASAYLAPRASFFHIAVLLGVSAVLVLLRWPPLGLLALVGAGMVAPFAIGTGTETSLNAAVLLVPALLGAWVLDMLVRHDLRLLPSRPVLPLLALCGAAIIAFLFGAQPWLVFAQTAPIRSQIGGLVVFLFSAGAFLLVGHQVKDVRWLRRLTWLFLGLGALYVVGRLASGVSAYTTSRFQPGSTGSLFWVWLVALSFGQAAFNRHLRPVWRLSLAGLTLATLYVALYQGRDWLSGWLPAIVALAVTLWVGSPRLALPVTVAGGLMAALSSARVAGLLTGGDNQYSLDTRVAAWQIIEQIVGASPVVGLGPANYYWYTPLFPILGYSVSFNSHNNYVDIVAQIGLLGLACFLWFAVEVGRLGWRLRARAAPGFGQAYVYAALGGLGGTLVAGLLGDWMLPFVYNIGLQGFRASVLGWVYLGGLVALERIVRLQSAAPVDAASTGERQASEA